MASAQRLTSLISPVTARASSKSYICKSCRSKLLHAPKANAQQLRYASNGNLPWTEKLRRKIWGTDNPPGLADPYGGPSFLERRKMRRNRETTLDKEEQERAALEELDREERERDAQLQLQGGRGRHDDVLREDAIDGGEEMEVSQQYTPAKTWHGLKHLGHRGHWEDIEPAEEDEYRPWYAKEDGGQQIAPPPMTREETEIVLQLAASEAGLDISAKDLMQKKLEATDPVTFQTLKNFTRLVVGAPFEFKDRELDEIFRNPNSTYADIAQLYIHAITTPPPKNLYETLAANEQLLSQSNVMVLPRRETPIDKEKEVGRWKVIEKELKERGLPVIGKLET